MSSAAALQKSIFEALSGDAAIMSIAAGIYDAVPSDPFRSKTAYISFGASDTVDDDAECIIGLEVTYQIDVWSRAVGSVECKRLTDLVRKALHHRSLDLSAGAMVDTRVELTRVFRDPDGITRHGVVQVSALIEEVD